MKVADILVLGDRHLVDRPAAGPAIGQHPTGPEKRVVDFDRPFGFNHVGWLRRDQVDRADHVAGVQTKLTKRRDRAHVFGSDAKEQIPRGVANLALKVGQPLEECIPDSNAACVDTIAPVDPHNAVGVHAQAVDRRPVQRPTVEFIDGGIRIPLSVRAF